MFVLTMTLNPQVQEKAWLELDTVIGRDRLPQLDDREKLPYVEHVLQEVYRYVVCFVERRVTKQLTVK
jgi:cytochrome P450